MAFGTNLRRVRESVGMSAEELADRLGVSRSAVYRYEAGSRFPGERGLVAISRSLETSLDSLMGIDQVRYPGNPECCERKQPGDVTTNGGTHGVQLSEESRRRISDFMEFIIYRETRRRREHSDGVGSGTRR